MGWVTTSLLILVAILILANVSAGFEEEEDAVNEEFEIRAKSNSGKKKVYLPSWAKKYTRSQTGCPCWWDLSRKEECACCWNKGIQCGYPLQKFCQRDANKPQYRTGCPGIKNRAHTLSERGHPCHYNPTKNNCGWCGLYSQQCNGWNLYNGLKCGSLSTYAPGKEGWGKYCIGQVQDCRISPSPCDVNAKCISTGRKTKGQYGGYAYRCACKSGYVGNGITCANAKTGKLEFFAEGLEVDLKMELAPQISIKRTERNFPIGKATTNFENELKKMQSANDGKEVFCNGNSGRRVPWNETLY